MLGKLTKYEFLATRRTFLPLYGALIVVSLLQGMSISTSLSQFGGILLVILPMVLSSLYIALVVITIMVMIRRFATMLGDEGYLMFTLPVGIDSLLCSKLLIVFIWMSISALVGFLCVGIIVVVSIPGAWEDFWRGWSLIWSELSRIPAHTTILAISTIVMGLLKSILLVYFAVAIGHSSRFSAHKVVAGIVAYILLNTALGALQSYLIPEASNWGTFFRGLTMNVFQATGQSRIGVFNGSAQDFQQASMYLLQALGMTSAYTAALYAATRYLISKKLNIE